MPSHQGGTVNAMEEVNEQVFLQELHDFYLTCSSKPEECIDLKMAIQQLIDEGVLQIEKIFREEEIDVVEIPYYPRSFSATPSILLTIQVPTTPTVIQAPIPPTSNDSKAVPWEYNMV